jgi:hypothetical protein
MQGAATTSPVLMLDWPLCALDLTLDEPFRKRARALGAGIGGYEELAIQIENRKHETRFVDLERVAGRNLGRAARQRTSLCRAGADPIRHHPVHRLVIGVPRFLL